MSMRGRSQKSAEPNKPRDSLNSSTIQKYLKSPGMENKQQEAKDKKKVVTKNKKGPGGGMASAVNISEVEPDLTMETDPVGEALPTKTEIQDMFVKLEKVIKAEILNLRTDMGHLLKRVEEVEKVVETQGEEISRLENQVKTLQRGQLMLKLEEQENQNRRQNLRIRSLPEQRGEDLTMAIKYIFNPFLGRNPECELKIDRVHRIRKPPNLRDEVPRDVIVKFHQFEDKAKIWSKLRGAHPVKYNNQEIQIFSDLSVETLARRRQLKPLLDILRGANLKYSCGFPLSLSVMKDGRSFKMRYSKDLQDFCRNLDIVAPTIPEGVFP